MPAFPPRLGRGLLFHVAPSNVPTMFVYTYVIAILAGNANIIRLSTRRGETEAELCGILGRPWTVRSSRP